MREKQNTSSYDFIIFFRKYKKGGQPLFFLLSDAEAATLTIILLYSTYHLFPFPEEKYSSIYKI
ncbi:hypothetical protein MC28_A02 (plasmid) [Bacillus thuringiensis MC28]|nr:hypothetical protein MC28_A02 [Bacillus thuringiensis MC28]